MNKLKYKGRGKILELISRFLDLTDVMFILDEVATREHLNNFTMASKDPKGNITYKVNVKKGEVKNE